MEQNNKRMQICSAAFIRLDDAKLVTSFDESKRTIQVDGEWSELPVKDAEFSEEFKDEGLYSQKFSARLANSSRSMALKVGILLRRKGLLRIDYTNGESIVVGDEEFPVLVNMTREGSPQQLSLSIKRNASFPSRLLQSL